MYTIQLLDQFSEAQQHYLQQEHCQFDLSQPVNGILVRSAQVPDHLLVDSLYAISRAGVGVNTINVQQCTQQGIAVINTPGVNANAVKELVLSNLLLAARPIAAAADMVQQLQGDQLLEEAEQQRGAFVGHELQGKTVGLLGLGAIGTLVARSCYELGMEVLGYARRQHQLDYIRQVALPELLAQSDFVVVLLPLTEETRQLLSRNQLEQMKPSAYLLNFGRGEIVDNQAILAGLKHHQLAGYITDFPQKEFLGNPKVFMLPHIGGTTQEALEDGGRLAVRHLRNFLLFGTIRESVNYPAVRQVFHAPHRLTIFYEDRKQIWAKIVGILAQHELELGDMSSNHKGNYVYTLIDLMEKDPQMILQAAEALARIPAIKRVRVLPHPSTIDK